MTRPVRGACARSSRRRSTGTAISTAASGRIGCGSAALGSMTPTSLRRIHAPGVELYGLVVDGHDEGLLELDFSEPGNCELLYFGVTARLIGTGAARFLMNRALEIAWSRDVNRVWVHTCTFDHPSAVAFYQRSGFRAFRRQIEVADDPRLDGKLPHDAARYVPVIA